MKGRYVISGGPGAGKTSLAQKLQEAGHRVLGESARAVIERELGKEQGILPWTDYKGFQELVTIEQLIAEKNGENAFLDRSLIDIAAYCRVGGIDIAEGLPGMVRDARYRRAFLLEQLPAGLYVKDDARRESPERAAEISEEIWRAYDKFGCDIVEVGFASLEERARLVCENIVEAKNREREAKYAVRDFSGVRKRLSEHYVEYLGFTVEANKVYLASASRNGYLARIRDDGDTKLTIKGPDRGNMVKDRMEIEFRIPRMIYNILGALPHTSYSKAREAYRPLGDGRCTICLDTVGGRNYVEIEAASETAVLQWKKRLGLGDEIKESYREMGSE